MRIVRAGDHRRMPWKNGGGETIELAVDPPGASLDAFDWRVSLARVAVDGPFSQFPGIDRTLAIVEGRGIILAIDGREHTLTTATHPVSFAGDVPTTARLLDGPIVDLNVMTRRGSVRHSLVRVESETPVSVGRAGGLGSPGSPTSVTLVLARAAMSVEADLLGIDDVVIGESMTLVPAGGTGIRAYVIELVRSTTESR